MSEKFVKIKEVPLNNNCPECYNNKGLTLSFNQKFVETKYYKSITSEIQTTLICKTCNNTIYPVQWTEDIEQVFEYQQRAFTPKKPSTFIKQTTWILIIAATILIIASIAAIGYFKL
ncbi:hypothetical protein [Gaetbulibacter saemankumensis]|uniref:hypothetical protein n=1 Tax=Gaetbulibacter saemankumensis TaxID=311208 RepID=UPI0003FBFE6A|nr:hypothetical protein [Gaetbulibacter saemankumensis]